MPKKFRLSKKIPIPIKMNFHELNFEIDENLTLEDRIDLLRKKGKAAELAFKEKYIDLHKWFDDYDQLYILSFCMRYFMLSAIGRDEEAEKGSLDFPPNYIELLQAFALTIPRTDSGKPLYDKVKDFKLSIKNVGELINLKLFNFHENIKTIEDVNIHQLKTQMMVHTASVRNWSYEHLMAKVTLDLSAGVDELYEKTYGYKLTDLIVLLYSISNEVEVRINDHIKKVAAFLRKKKPKAMMNTYEKTFDDVPKMSDDAKERLIKKFGSAIKDVLLMHSDLELKHLLTFNIPDLIVLSNYKFSIEQALSIFNELSYKFNDLKDFKKDYFILSNPIHTKPFINVQLGVYFSSLYTIMTHLSIGILENLVNKNKDIRDAYNKHRAKYLEEKVGKMFENAFPAASIFKGSMWSGDDGKLYENDLLVIIGSFVLVVESKSGGVSAPAKRGADDRLYKTLKELIEDPSVQAIRFIEYLKKHKSVLELKTKGQKKNVIDTRNLKYFIPLSVTLSHLGAISTNLKTLIKAGVTKKKINELAPSISITDLEIIFDLLPSTVQKLHYFQRRREIEANVEYVADEIDLLAWYLESGFNIGNNEYLHKSYYNLILKSKELDPYIINTAKGKAALKPALRMTTWWQAMLKRLETAKPKLWLENSFILLNMGLEGQEIFEKLIGDLITKVKNGKATLRHNWILSDNNQKERKYVIIGYPYTDEFFYERNDMMSDILSDQEEQNTKGALIIGINVDKEHYPYSVLCSKLSSQLFDSEFTGMISVDED